VKLPTWRRLAYVYAPLFTLLATVSPASAQTYSFGQLYLQAGTQTTSIASGDFNGDGQRDLVVANLGENTVSVFLGNPSFGGFSPKVDYATGIQPGSVAVGDFNGDGFLDIVVTNENCPQNGSHLPRTSCDPGSVSVLLGYGDGTFQPQVQFATGQVPVSVVVSDLNKDGKLDLVVANTLDNTVSILMGNGDGTFASHVDYATATRPTLAIVADFNNDTHPDIAAAAGGNVSVLRGNGDGTFQPYVNVQLRDPNAGTSLVAADFNRDGKQDLAVSGVSGAEIFLGNGDGTFTFEATYPSGSGAAIAFDVNHDGKTDLVVVGTMTSTFNPSLGVAVLLGNGDGTFQSSVSFASGGVPSDIVAGDFNGDGDLDLAISNSACSLQGPNVSFPSCSGGSVTVLLGNGHGVFGALAQNAGTVSANATSILNVDLNGDQKPDLVVLNQGDDTVSVLLGNGDGTFAPQVTYATGHMPVAVQAADFKGDGKVGLAVVNQICAITSNSCAAGTVSILLGNGDGTLQPHVDFGVGVTPLGLAITDFNGDSKPDLAVTNSNLGLGNTVSILTGKGDGTFNPHVDYTVVNEPGPIVAGDFNRDGKMDLAIACYDLANTEHCPAPLAFSILLGNGDATFQRHDFLTTSSFPHGASSIAIADFNADFNPDLVAGDATGSGFTSFLGKGDGTFQPGGSGTGVGIGQDFFTVGDFYGDTKLDVAMGEIPSRVVVFHQNDDGSFQTGSALMPPQGSPLSDSVPVSADFNGDGGLDLAVLQPSSADLSIFLNQPFKAVAPLSIDFHSRGLNTNDSRSITIANPSGAPFSITNIMVSGAPFSQIGDCIRKLLPMQSCTMNVSFAPTTAGTSNGTLTFTDTASSTPQVISLTGVGVNGPSLQLMAGRVIFPPTAIAVPSPDRQVSFVSTGNSPVVVTRIAITGGNSGDFSETDDCTSPIQPGASCTPDIIFTPTAAGTRTSTLVITDNAPGSPHVVQLTGTSIGSQIGLAPDSLTFAAQAVGTTSAAQTVTVTNRTAVGFFVTQISASGDFKQTNNCGGAVQASSTCQISVTFTPTAGGGRTGALTVAASPGSPQNIALNGTGGDFNVSTGSGGAGATATVVPGATATYPLSLTGGAGFSGSVALTCSGAPAAATCTVSPASVTFTGSTPATATVTVTTTAGSAVFIPTGANREYTRWRMIAPSALAALAALMALFLFRISLRHKERLAWVPVAAISALFIVAGMVISGCGGGSNSPPSSPTGGTGTAAGNYTITVTATAGSGANAVTHTTKLTLTVQ
jgi:hypothetical protein